MEGIAGHTTMEIGKKVVPMYEDNKNVLYLQIVYQTGWNDNVTAPSIHYKAQA